MGGYEIGISGLQAAQNALNVIGNNIANAATEEYHRQEVDLRPKDDNYTNGVLIGQGVDFDNIKRYVDQLLDTEIVNQGSTVSQLARELEGLRTMESTFAELSASALSSALDGFFNSLQDLSGNPSDTNLQNMVVADGETLAFHLQNMGSMLSGIEENTYNEARDTVDEINLIGTQIAGLNKTIYSMTVKGDNVNNLLDQRAGLVGRLSELAGVKTYNRENNVIDVTIGDTTIVIGSSVAQLEVGLVSNSGEFDIGIGPVGTGKYDTDFSGGKLGGLLSLRNTIARDVGNKLDTLAESIITGINGQHFQGVGTSGSFTSLSGWSMTSETLSEFDPPVSDGTIYIRITDAAGAVIRESFNVNASTHTLTDIRDWLGGLTGISNASTVVNSGQLEIKADAGYTFDFLGGVLTKPPVAGADNTMAGFGGAAEPAIKISGNYSGTSNETYTCTVVTSPAGQTGLSIGSGSMAVEVRNGAGNLVTTVNTGDGYDGSWVVIENDIKMSFGANGASPGYLNDGELFRFDAIADSDTSGVMAAIGINAFFSGSSALSIGVCDSIKNSPGNIAIHGRVEPDPMNPGAITTDNTNVLAMARLGETAMSSLGGLDPKSYYRALSTDIGKQISNNEIRYENSLGVWQNLKSQHDKVSGVDLNSEAARMMVFERMFQSMAKYLNTVNKTYETVMTIL